MSLNTRRIHPIVPIQFLLLLSLAGPVLAGSESEEPVGVPELVAGLASEEEDLRWLAVVLLADQLATDRVIVPALVARLADPAESWQVRAAAAAGLRVPAAAGERTALLALRTVALDPATDWRVRAAALEAGWELDSGVTLARWVDQASLPPELTSFDGALRFGVAGRPVSARAWESGDPKVRRLAVMAVGLSPAPDAESLAALAEVLGTEDDRSAQRAREALALLETRLQRPDIELPADSELQPEAGRPLAARPPRGPVVAEARLSSDRLRRPDSY
ncbi:MAG: hypothetical protein AAF533_07615 [Acidobacteriota bacterium]